MFDPCLNSREIGSLIGDNIGEIRNGKMVPHITPNAKPEAKARRTAENYAWLHNELLNDEEDWNALALLSTLR